jgi:hypothetical protein
MSGRKYSRGWIVQIGALCALLTCVAGSLFMLASNGLCRAPCAPATELHWMRPGILHALASFREQERIKHTFYTYKPPRLQQLSKIEIQYGSVDK